MRVLFAALVVALVAAPAALAGPTIVKTAHNDNLKATILVDARGLTLYYYVGDSPDTSLCIDDPTYHCSKHWVPLLAAGTPKAAGTAKQGLLGTTTRDDGRVQVTYKHRPLYYWKVSYGGPADKKPGDVYGQAYVSIWYVLSPAGKPIKTQRH